MEQVLFRLLTEEERKEYNRVTSSQEAVDLQFKLATDKATNEELGQLAEFRAIEDEIYKTVLDRFLALFKDNPAESILTAARQEIEQYTREEYENIFCAAPDQEEETIRLTGQAAALYLAGSDEEKADVKEYLKLLQGKDRRGFEEWLHLTFTADRLFIQAAAYYEVPDEVITGIKNLYQSWAASQYPDEGEQLSIEILTPAELTEKQREIGRTYYSDYFATPASPTTELISLVLTGGRNLTQTIKDANRRNKNNSISLKTDGNKRQITKKTRTGDITLQIDDVYKIAKNNKGIKKLLMFYFTRIAQDAYSKDQKGLYADYIIFPLQDLVDLEMYQNTKTARRAFNDSLDLLVGRIRLQATSKRKNGQPSDKEVQTLFTGGKIKDGICRLDINYKINWQYVVESLTYTPKWIFKLPNKAFDLSYYIFYLARQSSNMPKIAEAGLFTIRLRSIQERLGLPNENETKNPQRDIKDVIDKAINEIDAAKGHTLDLTITPFYDKEGNIREYLDNGYLEVRLSGQYAQPFIDIQNKKDEKLDNRKKKQEKIETEAAIRRALKE